MRNDGKQPRILDGLAPRKYSRLAQRRKRRGLTIVHVMGVRGFYGVQLWIANQGNRFSAWGRSCWTACYCRRGTTERLRSYGRIDIPKCSLLECLIADDALLVIARMITLVVRRLAADATKRRIETY